MNKPIFFRQSWVEIDKDAFLFNLGQVRSFLPQNTQIMPVVKSDAYGHGAAFLSRQASKLDGIYGFAVSNIEEALALREGGIKKPILILGRIFPVSNLNYLPQIPAMPTLSTLEDLEIYESIAARLKKQLKFHLAIDTGMGRVGLWFEDAYLLIDRISASKAIKMEGLYSHLAQADDSRSKTFAQLSHFTRLADYARSKGLKFLSHIANSPAIFRHKETHLDLVRPGVCLYGVEPFKNYEKTVKLRPVLSWKTRIAFIKEIPAGRSISYGGHFTSKKATRIAVLPIGYADGYDRLLSDKANVLINGQLCPVIGNVTMNMIMIDIKKAPSAKEGDEAVLIGAQGGKRIKADDLAVLSKTIGQETVCGISFEIPRFKDDKKVIAQIKTQDIAEIKGTIGYEILCSISKKIPRIPI